MKRRQLFPGTNIKKTAGQISLLLGVLMGGQGFAASLKGTVINESGEPLGKVPVCLQLVDADRTCSKVGSTDRRGNYHFNGLKAGLEYRVTIFQDDSAAGRRLERYRTYIWEPLEQTATLLSKNQTLRLQSFSGKFNFSNFQRELSLSSTDFPELSSIDLSANYVVLKVYTPANEPLAAPETIFLGQVASVDSLQIAVSVPLMTRALAYQIYSATLSIDGSIQLTGN